VKRPRASTLAVAAGFLIALGYVMWLLSPRFGIPSPSAIDDWNGASHGASSLVDLLRPFVESPVQRFRPGFGLFDYLEWHTLGAPGDMTGPNLWNTLRIALLVAAVGVVPALLARASRPELSPLALGTLAAVPPALVATGGAIAIDLARLAPQEPMLVGATICGAALVLLGLDRRMAGQSLPRALVPVAIGWPLFLIGATFKEASMCFLAVAPFLYLFLLARWRERGLARSFLDPFRSRSFLVCAVALILPLLWVTFRAATIGDEGADLYQAGAPTGTGEWGDRLRQAWNLQWASLTGSTGSPIWRALAVALPFLALGVFLDRRRAPWLALGLGLAAAAMLIVQGLPAVVTSRYFIPTMALLVMSTALLLAEGRAWMRWSALVAATILIVSGANTARHSVEAWASGEKQTSAFVAEVADLARDGCRLHAASIDVERAEALPRLVALQIDEIEPRCPLPGATLVATLTGSDPGSVGKTGLWKICRDKWRIEAMEGMWMLVSCDRVRERVDGEATAKALDRARLIPGVGPLTRDPCREREPDPSACDRPALEREQMWP
jgi:hypothetical protein